MENNTHKMHSVSEVAKMLGISRVAVFKKIKKGEIKAEKIGRNYIIHAKNLLFGHHLPDHIKEDIEKVVKRALHEYGEVFKRLSKE